MYTVRTYDRNGIFLPFLATPLRTTARHLNHVLLSELARYVVIIPLGVAVALPW